MKLEKEYIVCLSLQERFKSAIDKLNVSGTFGGTFGNDGK